MRDDQFDVNLVDDDLRDEVELLTQVMVAAGETDGHLTLDQVDAALGLVRPESLPHPRRPLDDQESQGGLRPGLLGEESSAAG